MKAPLNLFNHGATCFTARMKSDHLQPTSSTTLILLAAEPEFSERQLTRALIAAEAQGITLIVLNKAT